MKPLKTLLFIIGLIIIVAGVSVYFYAFAAPKNSGASVQFVIAEDATGTDAVASKLFAGGFIKNKKAFEEVMALKGAHITAGGYELSPAQNVFKIVDAVREGAVAKWVLIPEGLRKEEIAAIFGQDLGWSASEQNEWVASDTAADPDYVEGVYFPDTYLILASATPEQVTKQLQNQFNEKFAPYATEAIDQNIKWTTALTMASIVQREAAGPDDAPLISGILWNRLAKDMPLDVDATVQYARGDTADGWWAPITPADKAIDSPYNTYLYKGLPPHPIDDPGMYAIDAALNPQQTDCLYYLHDASGAIHCSATYAGQQKNIAEYLK